MKFIILLLAVSAYVALGAAENSLTDDFNDFIEILPIQEMKNLVEKYIASDPEYVELVSYLQSPEWLQIVTDAKNTPEVQKLYDHLKQQGLDLDAIFEGFVRFLTNDPSDESSNLVDLKNTQGFFSELWDLIPLRKITELFYDKVYHNENFGAFVKVLTSDETRDLVEDVRAAPPVKILFDLITESGLDVNYIFDIIYNILFWK